MEEPTPNHVVFILKIPKQHKKTFMHFKKGEYSKFPDGYKLQVLDFHRYDIDGPMGQILFKSKERKIQMEMDLDAVLPVKDRLELISGGSPFNLLFAIG